jgi:Transposase DDE domain
MIDNAVAMYCFLDDYLKAINHQEDKQRMMNDAEIIMTALLAALYFGGNHERALCYVREHRVCSRVLKRSRFSRRIHALEELMHTIFISAGEIIKQFNTQMEYVMDSFPVAVCHNIRIAGNHILPLDEQYRGKCVSKCQYFYGFRVQVIATLDGVPVEFAIVPGSWHDSKGMHALPMNLPCGSRNISDSAYTNYEYEDLLKECENIWHDCQRKSNSKRTEPAYRAAYKSRVRKLIESVFAQITSMIPRKIHATTIKGFLLKLKFFIWSFTFKKLYFQ